VPSVAAFFAVQVVVLDKEVLAMSCKADRKFYKFFHSPAFNTLLLCVAPDSLLAVRCSDPLQTNKP
jgi:hypothetical protein